MTTFWSDPAAGLKSIFTPSTPVSATDAGGPVSAFESIFGSGGDTLAGGQIRSYGVDPSTGKLIAPQYGASAAAAGYSSNDPQGFMARITAQVQGQYNADYQSSFDSLPLFPDVPGLPKITGAGDWLVIAMVLVLGFFLIKAVK